MNVEAIKKARKAVEQYRNNAPVGGIAPSKLWEGVKHEAPKDQKESEKNESDS